MVKSGPLAKSFSKDELLARDGSLTLGSFFIVLMLPKKVILDKEGDFSKGCCFPEGGGMDRFSLSGKGHIAI